MVKLGPHIAPLGMKFYTGSQFPAEYKNGIFIAEHGSWNRTRRRLSHRLHLGRSRRQEPEGDGVRQGGWLDDQKILGRPADILQAPDGSLLVADDQAGAIYQISYSK